METETDESIDNLIDQEIRRAAEKKKTTTKKNSTTHTVHSNGVISTSVVESIHSDYMERWKSTSTQNLSRGEKWTFIEQQQKRMYLEVCKIFPTTFIPGWFRIMTTSQSMQH